MCPWVALLLHRISGAHAAEGEKSLTSASMVREGDAKPCLCESPPRKWWAGATIIAARLWRDCGPKAFLVEVVVKALRVFVMNTALTQLLSRARQHGEVVKVTGCQRVGR
jgi:hypothetical protein